MSDIIELIGLHPSEGGDVTCNIHVDEPLRELHPSIVMCMEDAIIITDLEQEIRQLVAYAAEAGYEAADDYKYLKQLEMLEPGEGEYEGGKGAVKHFREAISGLKGVFFTYSVEYDTSIVFVEGWTEEDFNKFRQECMEEQHVIDNQE